MFLRYWLKSGFINAIAGAFIFFSFIFFGYAEYFDRIFIVFLVVVGLFNIKNVNVISIIVILMIERLLEEVFYFSTTFQLAKVIIYTLSIIFVYYFWYDLLVKRLILPLLIVVFIAEIYWNLIGYNPPRIHFYIEMIWLNIITRYLLFMRIPVVKKIFSPKASQTSLDWQLYSLAKWNVIIIGLLVVEYLFRHLTALNPLFLYHYYKYIIQLLSFLTLFFITKHLINYKFKVIM